MRHEGLKPNRDIIVALTADEEGGDFNGAKWLVENHRHLVDAEFCLNEGGGGEMKDGRRLINEVQASEKVYLSFRLEVTNPGGHSSLPTPDNAIYHLAEGLARLAKFDYPVEMNEVTRNFFQRASVLESGQVAADMRAVAAASPDLEAAARLAAHSAYYNAQMRTTCVATMLEAGQAANALPQRARAVVNCRLLPGSEPQTIQQVLVRVLADDKISVTPIQPAKPSPPSPLRPEILGPIERITAQMWPGVPVVATMCTGATDGLYFRQAGIPTYGVSGLFEDIDDVRAHGRDERVGVKQFYESLDFLYRLVKAFVS
jgi:acetylornithine deacetylase/succinyl-diaminopimelate desuccinylase-like protein